MTHRFQDIIVAKRLGTIELRVFDPTWDANRLRVLLKAVEAIASYTGTLPAGLEFYNTHREAIARDGYSSDFGPLYRELSELAEVPEMLLKTTSADEVTSLYESQGLLAAYSALDNGYRCGIFEPKVIPPVRATALKSVLGFAGYYLPKLPYIIWKFARES